MGCNLQASQSLSQVVAETGRAVEEMVERQEYFSWDSAADRLNTRQSTFDACFEFEECPTAIDAPTGQRWVFDARRAYVEPFQISLVCVQTGPKLAAELHFDAAVYHQSDIERLAEHFAALVDAATEPDTAIADLPLLTDSQRQEILVEWNDTQCEYPRDQRIDELIAQQTSLHKAEVAVESAASRLTYSELDRRANQLAHYLQKNGVRSGTLVGLCVERSPEMVVAILAILKAGGAYVPMDPSYPVDRLKFMLRDTSAPVLVTQSRFTTWAGEIETRVVCIDRDQSLIDKESDTAPSCGATADSLAYIIYTSGSTGTPKGVEIRHRNLVHSTTARGRYYGGSPENFLLLSSFAFDSSVAGIFWTLCQGGTLVLPPQGAEKDVDEIADMIAQHNVSTLLGLPSLYAMLLDVAGPSRLATLRRVIVAGEACSRRLVDRHCELLSQTALFNEYGPTEATVWSTATRCDNLPDGDTVPIGRPIANTKIYILDDQCKPVAVGVAGEIYIGGDGVARGYLGRDRLTAERFVPHPFKSNTDARLYRTGDLARYQSDGNIEFLGRIDHQVKIRGYRIELEEIEHVVGEHPDVSESVVTVHRVTADQPNGGIDFESIDPNDTDSLVAALSLLDSEMAERILGEAEQKTIVVGDRPQDAQLASQQNGDSA